jgi:hypothetical protein
MTDKELEQLFQKKLGKRTFAYNPKAWAGMEKLLDAQVVPWYLTGTFKLTAFAIAASVVIGFFVTKPSASTEDSLDLTPSVTISSNPVDAPSAKDAFIMGKQSDQTPAQAAEEAKSPTLSRNADKATAFQLKQKIRTPTQVANDGDTPSQRDATANHQLDRSSIAAQNIRSKPLHLPERTIAETPILLDAAQHNLSDVFVHPIPLTKRHARAIHHQLFVTGGLNFAQGLQANLPKSAAMSTNFSGGLRYKFVINRNWELNSALLYSRRGALNASHISHERIYGFGSESLETHRIFKQFDYLELPVTIGWTPIPGHAIQGGVYAARLIQTQSEVQRVYHLAAHSVTEIFDEQLPLSEGVNRWDYGLILGYEWQYNSKIILGVQGFMGMGSLLDEAYFNRRHGNFQGRLMLSYRI